MSVSAFELGLWTKKYSFNLYSIFLSNKLKKYIYVDMQYTNIKGIMKAQPGHINYVNDDLNVRNK